MLFPRLIWLLAAFQILFFAPSYASGPSSDPNIAQYSTSRSTLDQVDANTHKKRSTHPTTNLRYNPSDVCSNSDLLCISSLSTSVYLSVPLTTSLCFSISAISCPFDIHRFRYTVPQCHIPPDLTSQQQCDFVRKKCSSPEDAPGLIHYLDFYYCTMGKRDLKPLASIVLVGHQSWMGFLIS